MIERDFTGPEIIERPYLNPGIRSRSVYSGKTVELDEALDLEELEDIESGYLKPNDVAFIISNDGEVITPFHISLTRFMRIFGLELDAILPGRDIKEIYVPHEDSPDDNGAILSYKIRPFKLKLEAEIDSKHLTIDLVRDVFYVDPLVDTGTEKVDIRELIKNYPNNSYPEATFDLVTEMALGQSRYGKYII